MHAWMGIVYYGALPADILNYLLWYGTYSFTLLLMPLVPPQTSTLIDIQHSHSHLESEASRSLHPLPPNSGIRVKLKTQLFSHHDQN